MRRHQVFFCHPLVKLVLPVLHLPGLVHRHQVFFCHPLAKLVLPVLQLPGLVRSLVAPDPLFISGLLVLQRRGTVCRRGVLLNVELAEAVLPPISPNPGTP